MKKGMGESAGDGGRTLTKRLVLRSTLGLTKPEHPQRQPVQRLCSSKQTAELQLPGNLGITQSNQSEEERQGTRRVECQSKSWETWEFPLWESFRWQKPLFETIWYRRSSPLCAAAIPSENRER